MLCQRQDHWADRFSMRSCPERAYILAFFAPPPPISDENSVMLHFNLRKLGNYFRSYLSIPRVCHLRCSIPMEILLLLSKHITVAMNDNGVLKYASRWGLSNYFASKTFNKLCSVIIFSSRHQQAAYFWTQFDCVTENYLEWWTKQADLNCRNSILLLHSLHYVIKVM